MSNVGMTMCPPSFVHVPPPPPAWTMFLPEKMELRVVEYTKTDSSGIERIVKVELQYCMHNFDQYGNRTHSTPWESVERVKINMDA